MFGYFDIQKNLSCKNSNLKLDFVTLSLEKEIMRKIKLIWDFRGEMSAKTAEHHEIHLKEFIITEKLALNNTGFEILNDMYAIAFMVVEEKDMIIVRDALKPHRGEVY
jgi:hypothetical protein